MTQYKKEIINTLFKAQQNHEPVEFISKTYEVEEPVAYHIQDELISDNTASGLVAVGEAADPVSYKDFENITLKLSHNDEEIATGVSSDVLDNPIESLKWLIRKLDTQGKQLHKGEIVSSGTFVPPVPAKEGTYKAEYSYPGSIQVTFKP